MVGAYKYCYIAKRCDEMFKSKNIDVDKKEKNILFYKLAAPKK